MKSSASKQGQGERCCPNTSAHHTHGVNNGRTDRIAISI